MFGLAPVFLVLHLVRRSGEGVGGIGLAWDRPRPGRRCAALALFAVVGLAGLGVYLGAVELGVNRFVIPAPPLGHWWTVPVLVLNAAEAALVEEIIVLGYLVTPAAPAVVVAGGGGGGERAAAGVLPPVPRLGRVPRATSRWACCSACCSCGGGARGRS